MRHQRGTDSSGSSKRARRGAGAVSCALASAVLLIAAFGPASALGPADAAAAPSGSPVEGATSPSPNLSRFGETVIQALGGGQAENALHAIGHALVLSAAQERIAERERALAAAETAEEEAAEAAAAPELNANGEVKNPGEMPAASAGSNGTKVPHTGGGKLFAHTRVGDTGSTAILLSGIALAPPDVPEAVQKVINQANTIVGRPYVWGGGHASFYSYGYDCSGSVSYALFGAGLIPEPLTSGSLEGWGDPGPGKWITVYANAEHTFMEIDGLRWDTVGDARGTGPRWHLEPTSTEGFVARHPPGL